MQDWLDIDFAIQMGVDFIAVSFVKTADVLNNLKSYLESRSPKVIEIVAKVESHDSVPNCQEIIEASDAVMIARGDLGMPKSHGSKCVSTGCSLKIVQLSLMHIVQLVAPVSVCKNYGTCSLSQSGLVQLVMHNVVSCPQKL